MQFNKTEHDILFEEAWSKYLKENTALQSMVHNEDMDLDVTKEIAQELYNIGQKSVFDSVNWFFETINDFSTKTGLADWLHDKLGIN